MCVTPERMCVCVCVYGNFLCVHVYSLFLCVHAYIYNFSIFNSLLKYLLFLFTYIRSNAFIVFVSFFLNTLLNAIDADS